MWFEKILTLEYGGLYRTLPIMLLWILQSNSNESENGCVKNNTTASFLIIYSSFFTNHLIVLLPKTILK